MGNRARVERKTTLAKVSDLSRLSSWQAFWISPYEERYSHKPARVLPHLGFVLKTVILALFQLLLAKEHVNTTAKNSASSLNLFMEFNVSGFAPVSETFLPDALGSDIASISTPMTAQWTLARRSGQVGKIEVMDIKKGGPRSTAGAFVSHSCCACYVYWLWRHP